MVSWHTSTYKRKHQLVIIGAYHLKLAQETYVTSSYDVRCSRNRYIAGLHMYRFVVGDSWGGSENLNGEFITGNENRTSSLSMLDLADTTVGNGYIGTIKALHLSNHLELCLHLPLGSCHFCSKCALQVMDLL